MDTPEELGHGSTCNQEADQSQMDAETLVSAQALDFTTYDWQILPSCLQNILFRVFF